MALPLHPDARLYCRVARQRRDEAFEIAEELELWSAAQYLSGYAVECVLKALVITLTPAGKLPARGRATTDWMKIAYGHDLEKLGRAIAQRRSPIPAALTKAFLFVSTWDPNARYVPGPGDPKDTHRFLAAVDAIVSWADERM